MKTQPSESQILSAIIEHLKYHYLVAWAERMNTGAVVNGKRFVRFGFKGCSDVIGQLKDGRFLAIEVKSPTGRPSAEQLAFLDRVNSAGGVAFLARSVDDVTEGLFNA